MDAEWFSILKSTSILQAHKGTPLLFRPIEHDDSDDSQAAFLVPPLKSCWSPLAVVCSGGEGAVGDRIYSGGCRWTENVGRIPKSHGENRCFPSTLQGISPVVRLFDTGTTISKNLHDSEWV